ncbi:hypothetical protein KEM55_004090, partial [Ascosphaera atra]
MAAASERTPLLQDTATGYYAQDKSANEVSNGPAVEGDVGSSAQGAHDQPASEDAERGQEEVVDVKDEVHRQLKYIIPAMSVG